uniref:Lipase-like protein n=1 Tax=Oryza sativa subsp. japonica TaxID=39947 RepID=Q9AYI2_ORYSJ|nr:Putative lipase-like protein [Oryza sativa]
MRDGSLGMKEVAVSAAIAAAGGSMGGVEEEIWELFVGSGDPSVQAPGGGFVWDMPHVQSAPAAATAAGMSAASAPAPRRWEGVDQALERMVLRACLDQAPERRRVRDAFKDVQLSIDHCLFKGQYSDIGTKEVLFLALAIILQFLHAKLAILMIIGCGSQGSGTSYEKNSRGVEIFSKCWYPENHRIKAIVCLCHGYGDTCTFFLDGIARKIASAGYGVFALDYPGFGLSEGLHGFIPSFDTLVDDVAEHFTKVKENPEHRGLPSFLFGQSMGGAVALKIHFKQPNEWDGAILVAPMCKQVLIFMARLLPKEKLVPQKDLAELAFKEKKKQEQCSYNVIAYKDKPRLRTALEMLRTTKEIESRLEEFFTSCRIANGLLFRSITISVPLVSLPIIILHGEGDLVTDPAVSKALYDKAKSSDKTLRLYKDAYHAILEGEPDEAIFQVLDDIISWLDQHSTKKVPSS